MNSFRQALREVAFGPGSWALLALLAGSLGNLVQQWEETGEMPDAAAWRTVVLTVAFAGFRAIQAAALRHSGPREPAGQA